MSLAALLGFGTINKPDAPTTDNKVEQKSENSATPAAFMEDKTSSTDTVDIAQAQKKADDIAEFNENIMRPQVNAHPETVSIKGHNYFIFDDCILLPINEAWQEYIVPAAKDGAYGKISEYYLKEESANNWTQKYTIHKVNGFKDGCPEFAERLVNGVLVTLSDRMALQGNTLSKDNVSFNYARKENNDCIFFWGMLGLNEAQFVRVFRSEYTNDLYVATSAYKMDVTAVNDDFAGDKLAELASIQQLKKKS